MEGLENIAIRCEKCGSMNVVDEKIEDIKQIITMKRYVENYGNAGAFTRKEKRRLKCLDCKFELPYEVIVF